MIRRSSILLMVVGAMLLACGGAGMAQTTTPDSSQPTRSSAAGEILVKFKPGTSESEKQEVHSNEVSQRKKVIPKINVEVVSVDRGKEEERAAAYESEPNVEFAEPNGSYQAVDTPDDTQVGNQWQYNNTGQTGGTSGDDIRAYDAWDVTTGSSTVPIAILDTGIDQSHEDLSEKIAKNQNFTTTSSTFDDNRGHGTHVAGSAAADTNNSLGVAGTCRDCTLYNVKVLDDTGHGDFDWVAEGIRWATDNGAKVINMSLGGSEASNTVELAVNYAWSNGVIITAAAGNQGGSAPFYPAYYTNVIAVAATDHNDARATFSNYGSWVDVAAPGVSILSTAPDDANSIWSSGVKYGKLSGTSMATPHVAGVAGLVWSTSLCDANDNACVRDDIEDYSDPISGTNIYWSKGRLNAQASLTQTAAPDSAGPTVIPLRPSRTRDRTPVIAAAVIDNRTGLTQSSIRFYLDGVERTNFSYDPASGLLTYQSGRLSHRRHTVWIVATDAAGNSTTNGRSFKVIRKRK